MFPLSRFRIARTPPTSVSWLPTMRSWWLVCVCLLTSTGSGQELIKVMSSSQMRLLHAAMDMDRDAHVTLEEALALVTSIRTSLDLQSGSMRILATMDTNSDGLLSYGEFDEDLKNLNMDEQVKAVFRKQFSGFDDDGDTLLSQVEALRLFNLMFPFQKLDNNKDGLLTFREFKQIAAAKLQGATKEQVESSDAEARSIFAALDANADKRLDPKEHYEYNSGIYAGSEALKQLFAIADTNADKQLSVDELVELRQHQQFGGSAAFHHAQDWIAKLEEMVRQHEQQNEATAQVASANKDEP